GQFERGHQPRLIVVEQQLALVEVGDRLGKGEAEAGPFVGAARIQPPESAKRLFAPVERDAWSAIRDLKADLFVAGAHSNVDLAALRRAVADRVFDQVAERLGKQLAMTEKRHRPAWPSEAKRRARPRPDRTFRQVRRRARSRRTRRIACAR